MANKKSHHTKQKINKKQTNGFAILSLVFGIFFFVPFAPLLAIIFGFVALHQIKESNGSGKGVAIAGIILGIAWLLIWIIFILWLTILIVGAITSTLTTIGTTAAV